MITDETGKDKKMNQRIKQLLDKVSAERLMNYTAEVSKEVRISSLPEELRSLEYISSELSASGFDTQILRYPAYISYPVSAYLEVESPAMPGCRAVAVCFTPSTGIFGVKGRLAEFGDSNLAGKIVLADGLANLTMIQTAEAMGAVGVVCIHDKNIHNCPASDIWGAPEEFKSDCLTKIPVISITRESGNALRDAMKKSPVTVRMESTVVNEWRDCPILVCDLKVPGTEKFVLFSGHIDSWDYGSMDNGSANATMIECAKLLAEEAKGELKRGLRVCFWSGHSQGKYAGSSWYVDHNFEEIEENCCCHVNIDSVGGMDAVVVEEAPVMPQTWKLAAEAVKEVCGVEFTGKKIARNSDQSFLGIGVSSIFGTFSEQDAEAAADSISFRSGNTSRAGGLGWWWHTEHDTMDKLDPELLARDCRVYLYTIYRLLTGNALPLVLSDAGKDMLSTIDRLAEKCGKRYDFSELRARTAELEKLLEKLDQAAYECAPEDTERITTLQIHAAEILTRLTFHEANIYDFDKCGGIYPIPALAAGERLALCAEGSSRFHMAETELTRGCNRVMCEERDLLAYLKREMK